MTKVKFFSACTLCVLLMCTTLVFALDKPTKPVRNVELVREHTNLGKSMQPNRDEDEFMTFRYVMSSDGGESWSEPMGAGDTGMWDGEGEDAEPAWNTAGYRFGAGIDNDNMLHFIAPLTAFNPENNPLERVNGIYDVVPDGEGGGTYDLIIAQPEGASFVWADAGKDADGNGYCIWVSTVEPEEGDPYSELWAAKTTDEGGWSDGFLIANNLDMTHHYPHMTDDVGDNFYVLYQIPNVETGMFDHYVAEVPASLEGEANVMDVGVASPIYYSYYVGSVGAIAQDVDEGFVYFSVRNEDVSATAIGSYNGEEWTIESIDGAQRYPSMMMMPNAEEGGTPWVFSNVGPPGPDQDFMHHNWFSYDALGYNGGDWIGQNQIMSILYENGRSLLYCHTGVVTSEGRVVSGSNVWGAFTPDAFQTAYSDDFGESWTDPMQLWSIYDDGDTFRGGFIAQNHMLAGMDNTIFVAFCGMYGASDFDAPLIDDEGIMLSSYMLDEEWKVTVDIIDFEEISDIVYADVNWTLNSPQDTVRNWDYVPTDSMDVDDRGYGTYMFTIPSDSMFGEALVAGDEIWFFIFAADEVDQYAFGIEHKIVVGESFVSVEQPNLVLPATVELGQNYPNPFNDETVIPYSVNSSTDVKLSIFDINGRLIENLVNGRVAAGNHTVSWRGDGASTGVYFYIMEAAGQRHVAKLTLLR